MENHKPINRKEIDMGEPVVYEQIAGGMQTGRMFEHNEMSCDICGTVNPDEYVAGRTHSRQWVSMCMACYGAHGVGVGLGSGQMYKRQYNV
jgi:hypothetical protein